MREAARAARRVSVETLRRWMSEDGSLVPRAQRARRPQAPRYRRPCLGELVQIDGCDHEWFEDRGPRCTLLVYVDDATSRLMELRFVVSASAFSSFASAKRYLELNGKLWPSTATRRASSASSMPEAGPLHGAAARFFPQPLGPLAPPRRRELPE